MIRIVNVRLTFNPRDLSYVNEAGDRLVAPSTYTILIGSGQPLTGAPAMEAQFTINGQKQLPE
jgi:hypothetical protein